MKTTTSMTGLTRRETRGIVLFFFNLFLWRIEFSMAVMNIARPAWTSRYVQTDASAFISVKSTCRPIVRFVLNFKHQSRRWASKLESGIGKGPQGPTFRKPFATCPEYEGTGISIFLRTPIQKTSIHTRVPIPTGRFAYKAKWQRGADHRGASESQTLVGKGVPQWRVVSLEIEDKLQPEECLSKM